MKKPFLSFKVQTCPKSGRGGAVAPLPPPSYTTVNNYIGANWKRVIQENCSPDLEILTLQWICSYDMIISTSQVSMDELKQFLLLQNFDNSLVSCGMDIAKRMDRMEAQLR